MRYAAYLKDLARAMLIVILVMLASAGAVALLTGCASRQVREVCGTLPDGSEFCTLIVERRHA